MSDVRQSDSTILDRPWSRLSVSKTVDAHPTEVRTAIADHEQWLTWYRPLKEFTLIEGTELALGTVVYEHEGPWKSTSIVLEWEEGRVLGLAMRSLNLRGLLSTYYRRIELQTAVTGEAKTEVTITGGFAFGPLGWLLVGYTYPQMMTAMYFEYRSALKGLAEALDPSGAGEGR